MTVQEKVKQIQASQTRYSALVGGFTGLIGGAVLLLLVLWELNTYGLGAGENDVHSLGAVAVIAAGVAAVAVTAAGAVIAAGVFAFAAAGAVIAVGVLAGVFAFAGVFAGAGVATVTAVGVFAGVFAFAGAVTAAGVFAFADAPTDRKLNVFAFMPAHWLAYCLLVCTGIFSLTKAANLDQYQLDQELTAQVELVGQELTLPLPSEDIKRVYDYFYLVVVEDGTGNQEEIALSSLPFEYEKTGRTVVSQEGSQHKGQLSQLRVHLPEVFGRATLKVDRIWQDTEVVLINQVVQ